MCVVLHNSLVAVCTDSTQPLFRQMQSLTLQIQQAVMNMVVVNKTDVILSISAVQPMKTRLGVEIKYSAGQISYVIIRSSMILSTLFISNVKNKPKNMYTAFGLEQLILLLLFHETIFLYFNSTLSPKLQFYLKQAFRPINVYMMYVTQNYDSLKYIEYTFMHCLYHTSYHCNITTMSSKQSMKKGEWNSLSL